MNVSFAAPSGGVSLGLNVEQVRRIAEIAALDKGGFPWWARLMLTFAFACSMAWFCERMGYLDWLAKKLAPKLSAAHGDSAQDDAGHKDDPE
jgi:hypothetical protein